MLIQVTDTAGTSGTITINHTEIADAIAGWYPDAPPEVTDAITNLQDALNRDDYTQHDLLTYLGLEVTAVLTLYVGEGSEQYYTDAPDGTLIQHDVTPAVVLNDQGEQVDSLSGPAGEEWDGVGWDAALADAGYRRVSEWLDGPTSTIAAYIVQKYAA